MQATIVNYGRGNLWSVKKAIEHIGVSCVISSDPREVCNADTLILPGVGSFSSAIETLHKTGLSNAIIEAVHHREKKILGICLGFQLLSLSGTEHGITDGLGFIPSTIDRFETEETGFQKIPHVGFNKVFFPSNEGLYAEFGGSADFYFAHSYRMLAEDMLGEISVCNYGIPIVAAYHYRNIVGVQFHPEKSQTNGIQFLKNFFSI